MGITQKLIAAARAYRDDPKRNRHLFVEAINASTNTNKAIYTNFLTDPLADGTVITSSRAILSWVAQQK